MFKYLFLFLCFNLFSIDFIIISDMSQNIDYFVSGKEHKYKKDLKNLYKAFESESNNSILSIEIEENDRNFLSGRVIKIENNIKTKKTFKKVTSLSDLYLPFITNETHLILHGHTFERNLLSQFFQGHRRYFNSISLSACQMATLENINYLQHYTSKLLISSQNVHLAHFDLVKLIDLSPRSFIKDFMQMSFNRLTEISKSNVAFSLFYLRDKKITCHNYIDFLEDNFVKLSKFERREKNHSSFKVKGCN